MRNKITVLGVLKLKMQRELGNNARYRDIIGVFNNQRRDCVKSLCHGKLCHRHDHIRLLPNLKSNSNILSFMIIKFFLTFLKREKNGIYPPERDVLQLSNQSMDQKIRGIWVGNFNTENNAAYWLKF